MPAHVRWGDGVVAAGHEATVRAALAALERGGNAFDAAVAGGLAACVAEPGLTSLGGAGFLMAKARGADPLLFDFAPDTPGYGLPEAALEPHFLPVTVRFPGADQVFNTGLGSAAVPGVLKGYLHVHARLGRLPLAEVVRDAVRLAREGVPLAMTQAYVLSLLEPILTLTEAARALFAPEGRFLRTGDVYRNPDLADFLLALADDPSRTFYEGALAETIARDMADGAGLVTAGDLSRYEVVEREPLRVRYRDRVVLLNPPPSFGGGLIALSLALLSPHDALALRPQSAERIPLLHANMVEVDRRRACNAVPAFTRGTTHLSVADREGNVASLTTSNGEGAGYIVPGTGIMLNNMLGEDDLHPDGFHAAAPGERVASMMAPSIVLRGGEPEIVIGSGGSKRIRTAMVQVLSSLIDGGADIEAAVRAPRVHWDGEILQIEPGAPEAELGMLAPDVRVNVWEAQNLYFGGVHAIIVGADGSPPCAAGDPRREGASGLVSRGSSLGSR